MPIVLDAPQPRSWMRADTANVRLAPDVRPEITTLDTMLNEEARPANQVGQSPRNAAVVQWLREIAPRVADERGFRVPTNVQQRQFKRLAATWKATQFITSNPQALASHPAYLQIMSMGTAAVPLILTELAKSPD